MNARRYVGIFVEAKIVSQLVLWLRVGQENPHERRVCVLQRKQYPRELHSLPRLVQLRKAWHVRDVISHWASRRCLRQDALCRVMNKPIRTRTPTQPNMAPRALSPARDPVTMFTMPTAAIRRRCAALRVGTHNVTHQDGRYVACTH